MKNKKELLQKKSFKHTYKSINILDDSRKIKFSENVIQTVFNYIQVSCFSREAGGVLLGREEIDTGNIVIDVATEPSSGDKRSRYSFYRKDDSHIQRYELENRQNRNIYLYIGEWHTHPEEIPHYSSIDSDNWKNIGHQDTVNDFQYHLIAGTDGLCIWKFRKVNDTINLVFKKAWGNLIKGEM